MAVTGYKISNEWNGFVASYRCGDCLDTSTGVDDMTPADGEQACIYCNRAVADYDTAHADVEVPAPAPLADWEIQLLADEADSAASHEIIDGAYVLPAVPVHVRYV